MSEPTAQVERHRNGNGDGNGVRAPRRVLVIAAHPDDELLGCGGTIALHTRAGDHVTAVIVCEGESLRYGKEGVGQANHIKAAADTLGVRDVRCLGFPDQRLDTFTLIDLITPIEKVVREISPQIVYCQYGGDVNRDHELLFKATLVATRPTELAIESVYAFDTASSTEWAYPRSFNPDTWIEITETLEQKIAAMACYRSEVRAYPHPRSLDALRNRARAWGNQACLEAAEVFMTIRRTMRHGETSD
jgi:LmbE family N-acetylglucosaminyl deacetylase